jgi:hypothetical protein
MLTDDGTNRQYQLSTNGRDYHTILTQATNTFLTPTRWGISTFNNATSAVTTKGTVYHLQMSPGVLGDIF